MSYHVRRTRCPTRHGPDERAVETLLSSWSCSGSWAVPLPAVVGLLLVRRALRSRQRMIDAVGEAPGPACASRRPESWRPPRNQKRSPRRRNRQPSPGRRPPSRGAPRGRWAHRAREAAKTGAGAGRARAGPRPVIPFPAPARKGAALIPGLEAHPLRLHRPSGRDLSPAKQIDPSVVDEIEKVLADRRHRRAHGSQKPLETSSAARCRASVVGCARRGVGLSAPARPPRRPSLPAAAHRFAVARPFVLLELGVNGVGKTTDDRQARRQAGRRRQEGPARRRRHVPRRRDRAARGVGQARRRRRS